MAKSKKIHLSVPEPCLQNWGQMTPVEKGRFCKQCDKSVIDFTTYTDKELLEFFSQPKERTCGHFRSTQLNRLIAIQEPGQTPFWHKIMLGASIATGIATSASGQNNTPPQKYIQQVDTKNKTSVNNLADSIPTGDTTHIISGVVIDDSLYPISNATIILMEDSKVLNMTGSYSDGHFILPVDGSLLGQTLTIRAVGQGHTYQEIKIELDRLPYNNVSITLDRSASDTYIIDGMVSTIEEVPFKTLSNLPPPSKDSTSKQDMLNEHLGTPASLEGPQEPNR